jgi:predicted RNase H-like HicB family nuclease
MISDYVEKALQKAHYEIIEDAEPFYGEVAELQGVWATGKTLEECRSNLASTIEGWILVRISRHLNIPELDGITITTPKEMNLA